MSRAHRGAGVLILTCALGLAVSGASLAQSTDADKAQARELVQEGLKDLRANDFAGALKAFSAADKLFHAPTTIVGVARANVGLKRFVAAQEAYNRLIREPLPPNPPEAFQNAVDEGRKELEALVPRIPNIIIEIDGPKDPSVTLDGQPLKSASLGLKKPVDPGKHTIAATAPGYLPGQIDVTATEGNATPVPVKLTLKVDPHPVAAASASAAPIASATPIVSAAPAASTAPVVATGAPATDAPPPPASDTQKYAAYAAWGVGGAGLVVGVIGGVLAIGKKSSLDDACKGGVCPDSAKSTHDSYKTMGTVSTVGFVVAGVGAAAGTVLFLTAPKSGAPSATVGLGTVGLAGSF